MQPDWVDGTVIDHEDAELELATLMGECYADPLKHVMVSYEWGKGQLEGQDGPDEWQRDFLLELGEQVAERGFDGVNAVMPIQFSTSSGHGIGKSCMTAWIIRWIMDTRPHCKGIVTANTSEQLRTKTWAELAKWHHLGITKHWYKLNAGGAGSMNMYHLHHSETWRVDAQTCKEENSEAFAGLHALTSTPFYIFDEAGGISDKIFEVREGGLTDGQPMTFDWGNPTRNTGRFHANMVGKHRDRYIRRTIDSRTVKITNKLLLNKWIDEYGIDSDFVKVRVLGQFPAQSGRQFISQHDIDAAMRVHLRPAQYEFAPIIIGVDPAWTGDDPFVIYLRQGLYTKKLGSYPFNDDDVQMANIIARFEDEYKADAVFVDAGYGTGIVSVGNALNRNWQLVWFGEAAPDPGFANMRAYIWNEVKKWLKEGGCLEEDEIMRADLGGPETVSRLDGKIQLESKEHMKERDLASPNDGDSLAVTFAYPVAAKQLSQNTPASDHTEHDYDPI